jgi:hypothetical protein
MNVPHVAWSLVLKFSPLVESFRNRSDSVLLCIFWRSIDRVEYMVTPTEPGCPGKALTTSYQTLRCRVIRPPRLGLGFGLRTKKKKRKKKRKRGGRFRLCNRARSFFACTLRSSMGPNRIGRTFLFCTVIKNAGFTALFYETSISIMGPQQTAGRPSLKAPTRY